MGYTPSDGVTSLAFFAAKKLALGKIVQTVDRDVFSIIELNLPNQNLPNPLIALNPWLIAIILHLVLVREGFALDYIIIIRGDMSSYSFTVLCIVNTPRKAKINVDEGEGSLFIYLVPILLENRPSLIFL